MYNILKSEQLGTSGDYSILAERITEERNLAYNISF